MVTRLYYGKTDLEITVPDQNSTTRAFLPLRAGFFNERSIQPCLK
jgi:hypothetical protein